MQHVKNIAPYKYFQMTEIKEKKKAYFGKSNIYDIDNIYIANLKKKKKHFEKADVKDTSTIEYVFKFHHCLCWFATGLSTQQN